MARDSLKLTTLKIIRDDDTLWHLVDKATKQPLILVLTSEQFCQPCKELHPHLKPLADEYEGRLTFAKADPEDMEDDTMTDLDVDAVPTILFIYQGEVIDQYDGFENIADLKKFLNENLKDALH